MIVILVCAKTEWTVIKELVPEMVLHRSPFGEWGERRLTDTTGVARGVLFQCGWGKIKAAAATQYVIDRFSPELVINIGTCGGFSGEVNVGQILLVGKTIVYDIQERIGDPALAIEAYTTVLDLNWINVCPPHVKQALMVSGDCDLDPAQIGTLKENYGAVAGDWESGAIAHICHLNGLPCLILRGVSDLVSPQHGEAYGDPGLFKTRTLEIMRDLYGSIPFWIEMFMHNQGHKEKSKEKSR